MICSFGPGNGERIIVGAHYDVYREQPGADDNASGVAGLLEIVRLLKSQDSTLKYLKSEFAGDGIANISEVVILGTSTPFCLDNISSNALGSAVLVPIPTLSCATIF